MEISINPLHRRLQCLRWIFEESSPDVLAENLLQDGAISKHQMVEYAAAYDRVEYLFILLEKAASSGEVQLLHYEWSLFPKLKARVEIVTAKRQLSLDRSE